MHSWVLWSYLVHDSRFLSLKVLKKFKNFFKAEHTLKSLYIFHFCLVLPNVWISILRYVN